MMYKLLFILLFLSCFCTATFAQQKEAADKLAHAGISDHDKGDYKSALKQYDQALSLDSTNLLALAEKAYTLVVLEQYDASIQCAQKAIDKHPGDDGLKTVYITYGNALDALKKPDKSLDIYQAGLTQFPDFYLLHFNKGITLSNLRKFDEAILCFHRAVRLNPNHAGSHNAMARLLHFQHKDIPALLAYCRLLVLEPESSRAAENLAAVQKIMQANVEQESAKSVKITLPAHTLGDTTAGSKPKVDEFASVTFFLALTTALDAEKKYKKETNVSRFARKLEAVCTALSTQTDNTTGFYWAYYVPYFTEMQDKDFVETFAYIAFASSDDAKVDKWLKAHPDKVEAFYTWSEGFGWKQ